MPPSIAPNVIDELVEALTTNSQMLLGASKLSGRDKEDSRDLPVREILKRSSEFSRACAALGREDNATALSILTRATLEDLILMLWIIVSEKNAKDHMEAGITELRRATKINIEQGLIRIKRLPDGEDATVDFLMGKPFENMTKRKSVEDRAKEAGVLDLYTIFYRFMSMDTHGHDTRQVSDSAAKDATFRHMNTVGVFSKATGHAGTLWLLGRKRVDNETLRDLLGFN